MPANARPLVASVQQPWNAQLPMVRLIAGPVAVGADVGAVEVAPAEELLGATYVPLSWYKLSLPPAPQYSVPLSVKLAMSQRKREVDLPAQVMLQPEASVGTEPAPMELPHQHSPPYSNPA